MLGPAAELTYDDAPWMSATLRGGGGPRFVHEEVGAVLAERLGARSLRYMLLLEEKITDTLPCPAAAQVARALGEAGGGEGGGEAHLLLDLLEVADVLGAKAAHFCIDRRRHRAQSLLSPALAPLQAEALCLWLPGVAVTREQLVLLQQPPSDRSLSVAGRTPRFGNRLLAMYQVSDVPAVASGEHLYLFDPTGAHLASSLAQADGMAGTDGGGGGGGGGGAARRGQPVGRAYPMVHDELPRRFPDQFEPLRLFGWRPGAPMDGTLLRLPLRSHAQAASSTLCSRFWSASRMRDLVCALQRLAPSVLLGLESIDALTCSEWGRDSATPTRTLQVSLALPQHDAARRGGLVRDGSWRKTSLSSLLGAAGLGGVVPSGMG